MRLYNRVQVLKLLNQHLGVYPTPMNLNWNWSWGSLSGLLLGSQIITGILLAMHYVGHVDHAFASVQHLMVDVPSGVIIRYAHANGASLFFTVVYLHVLRGLYYSSGTQPREIVWISGVIILLLMIITAFIGYVLPWGKLIGPTCISIHKFMTSIEYYTPIIYAQNEFTNMLLGLKLSHSIYTQKHMHTLLGVDVLQNILLNKTILINGKSIKIDPIIISVSVGSLLADAHCEKRGNSTRLSFKQSNKHSDWFFWLHFVFSSHHYCNPVKPILKTAILKSNQKTYSYYRFSTYNHPLFQLLHPLFYISSPNNKYIKVLNVKLIPFINALAIAVWIADDGYNRNGSTAFCTDSFDPPSLEILIKALKENHGITLETFRHANYTRLRVIREDMPKFALLVKPYLHESMRYKLGDFIN